MIKGTNRVAIESRCDILAHPGRISKEDAKLAKRNGVHLEITARKTHSKTNAHVAKMAMEVGAHRDAPLLILNTDAHTGEDFITDEEAKNILGAVVGAYCNTPLHKNKVIEAVFANSRKFLK